MEKRGAQFLPSEGVRAPSTIEMVEADSTRPGRINLSWWYRFSAPAEPAASASLQQREAYRRGKLISIALLGQIAIIVALVPTIGVFVNHALIPNLIGMLIVLSFAVILNRGGRVIIAGILAVAGLDLSLMLNFLAYPDVTVFLLPLLDLLVLPELFAVSLLPAWAVFVAMFIHIAFIVSSLTFLFPQSAELRALLHTSALQDALARPIAIQVLVAVISYLWVSSATQAIARANRATTIAAFERAMAEQNQAEIEQKRLLEESIQMIVQVHARVANGNMGARVPLAQGNVLWEVAGSLNTLLARLQRLRQDAFQLQQTNQAIALFLRARERANNGLIPWQPTGTAVDALVMQHNSRLQSAVSLEQGQHSLLRNKNHLERL